MNIITARLAQLVERKALNLVVEGSSPSVGVRFFPFFSVKSHIFNLKKLIITTIYSILSILS